MSIELKGLIVGGILVLLVVVGIILKLLPKKLNREYFQSSWQELQAYCKDAATWPVALVNADKLLDNALKKRKFKGRSMGERMVAAQRTFSENDVAWFAHNLAKKISTNKNVKLKEKEVRLALMGFRQALRDLGALPNEKQ